VETDKFVVRRVDVMRSCEIAVRGDVIARVEPDVIVMALTLETKSVSNAVN
jgi:hypothetical protein